MLNTLPILTTEQVQALETVILGGDKEKAWAVIKRVGSSLGHAVLEDYCTWRTPSRSPSMLILCGKGHNAADALLTAHSILEARPRGKAVIIWGTGKTDARPLASRALETLKATGRLLAEIELDSTCSPSVALDQALALTPHNAFDLTLDGLFGCNFHSPLPSQVSELLDHVNDHLCYGLRVAIDIPSGLTNQPSPTAFKAHFTYQTGIPKSIGLNRQQATYLGRVRVVDLGFFKDPLPPTFPLTPSHPKVLLPAALQSLGALRSANTHKYEQGTVAIVAGSSQFPGALLLTALGVLRSGVGLVRAFAPAALIPSFAAACPEVIWAKLPETPEGHIHSLDLLHELQAIKKLGALVIGPGLGAQKGLDACVHTIGQALPCPIVFDADALMADLGATLRIRNTRGFISALTPHAGEFKRLTGLPEEAQADEALCNFAKINGSIVCLKGYLPRISDGQTLYHILAGGPILARGGTGDILAGLMGGLLAEVPLRPAFETASLSVLWHALAGDVWARHTGERATRTTDLLRYLPEVLRSYTTDL